MVLPCLLIPDPDLTIPMVGFDKESSWLFINRWLTQKNALPRYGMDEKEILVGWDTTLVFGWGVGKRRFVIVQI